METKVKNKFRKITAENVRKLGEMIAIHAMKITMAYSGKSLDDLYAGLIHDIFDYKPIDEPYSDGYDIASEAICFLCGHIGQSLDDEFKTDKKGRVITIRHACYRVCYKYIEHQRRHIYNTTSYNTFIDGEEPSFEVDYEQEHENNNEILDTLISNMNLSQGQLDTLNCYMAGMTFTQTAEFLAVNLSTVWRRIQHIQQIYTQKVANAAY